MSYKNNEKPTDLVITITFENINEIDEFEVPQEVMEEAGGDSVDRSVNVLSACCACKK
ncbi:hypothetical protein [Salicibibacter cibarius]|uniref:hypothetical protein n=1 Tax=Salicibibacter cibarius TaxID=2743000 RepID=UPI003CCD6B8E